MRSALLLPALLAVALSTLALAATKAFPQDRAGQREDAVPEAAKRWAWSAKQAGLEACAKNLLPDFDVALVATGAMTWPARSYTLRVEKAKKVVLAVPVWEETDDSERGRNRTALARRKNVLFVAEFQAVDCGCSVSGYDLETGKRAWQVELEGVGCVLHSGYENRVQMESIDEVLVVRGDETAGRYLECRSTKDGHAVWHQRLKK